jgi:hypothetical protein
VLGQRQERVRQQHPVLRVSPAGQRLRPGDQPATQVDLGLDVDLDVAPLQGLAKFIRPA